jgi:hypothetical protein
MALVEHHSLVYLNMLGSKGFVVAVVSLVIALQLLVSRKASCVNCYKQWGYKMHWSLSKYLLYRFCLVLWAIESWVLIATLSTLNC